MMTSRRPLRQVRRAMLVASSLSAVSTAALLGLPVVALHLLESAVPAGAGPLIGVLAAIAGGLLLVAAAFDLIREVILVRAAAWLDHTMGLRVVETAVAEGTPGRALNARSEAVETLRAALAEGRLTPVVELPWVLLACAAIALIEPQLALLSFGAILAMGLAILLFAASSAGRDRKSAKFRADVRLWTGTLAANPTLLNEQGLHAGAALRWELLNRGNVAHAYAAALRLGLGRVCARALNVAANAGMLGAGAYLAVQGRISMGAVLAAVLVSARAFGTLQGLGDHWAGLRQARLAWRLLKSTEESGRTLSVDVQSTGSGPIILRGAACAHGGQTTPVLSELQLVLAPASAIGIVGAQGAGKTALAALLAGVNAPLAGHAEIDGIALHLAQRSPAGAPVGYLSDDPRLVEGSVLQNIAGFRKDWENAAEAAASLAGVHDLIARLPDGFATQVGVDGRGVSLRIRRAVALARALCGPRRFVVLDQPETGLDEAGLMRLERMLVEVRQAGIGVLLATNEPRLLRLTDDVVMLASGCIEAIVPTQRFAEVALGLQPAAERTWPRRVA